MPLKFPSSKSLNLLSLFFLISGLLLWIVLPSYAQEEPADVPTDDCLVEIADDVAVYDADFANFIQQHYLSELPASELSKTAVLKFQEYKNHMRTLYLQYSLPQGGNTISDTFNQADACKRFAEDHITIMEAMLRSHNVQNSGGKVTYTLVEKLKDLNEKLKTLNEQFADLYGSFLTFSNKLPGTTP